MTIKTLKTLLHRRRNRDNEITEEIESHLRMAIQDRMDRGESAGIARAAAVREFGNIGSVQETTRAVWIWTALEQLLLDLHFGVRILWKSPGLSGTVAILIALVIGGNAAIYSMIHSLITRQAPGVHAERLVTISFPGTRHATFNSFTARDEFAKQNQTMSALFAFGPARLTLGLNNGSYALYGAVVSGEFFDQLGVKPLRGRTFNTAETPLDTSGIEAVISYQVWQERFQTSETAIGQTVTLNGHSATIVGITPPLFQGPTLGLPQQIWVPAATYFRIQGIDPSRNGNESTTIIGTLKAGVSLSKAEAEFKTMFSQMKMADTTIDKNLLVQLTTYKSTDFGGVAPDGGAQFLAQFQVVTAITLLIVCATVTNLMLARAISRQRETVVRQALGASRMRIVRLLVAEGLAVSALAWVVAAVFTFWITRIIRWVLVSSPSLQGIRMNVTNMDFTPDWRVLVYAAILAIIAVAAFTVAPALRACRRELAPHLKAGGQTMTHAGSKLTRALVVGQIAFTVVMLTSVGLTYRTLSLRDKLDLRFNKDNVLLVTVNSTLGIKGRSENLTLLERARERFAAIPGVTSVSYVRMPPPYTWRQTLVAGTDRKNSLVTATNYVGADYLRVLELAPVEGREFSSGDRQGSAMSVVINRDLADALWPGQSAIGQIIRMGNEQLPLQVVGVAPNARYSASPPWFAPIGSRPQTHSYLMLLAEQQDASAPTIPLGLTDPGAFGSGEMTFYIRYSTKLDSVVPNVSAALKEIDPRIPIVYTRTMNDQISAMDAGYRQMVMLLTFFATISVVISAIGQYAVVAFNMKRRMREFGVHMAMGASPREILHLVLREGLRLTFAGIVAGFVLSAVAGTLMKTFLLGTSPTDGLTYLSVFTVVSIASLLACYLPANRASRADPLIALRCD